MPAPDRKRRLTAFVVAMAVLIATPLAVVAADAFNDVPDSNVHHEDITWLRDNGVTFGCNPPANTEFCPAEPVLRQQMASFMRRLAENQVVDAATALEANHATTADSADTADSATTAETADSAGDADTLDGIDSTGFVPSADRDTSAWIIVEADGSVLRQSGDLTATKLSGTGRYKVDHPNLDESQIGFVASSFNSPGAGTSPVIVTAFCNDSSGCDIRVFDPDGTAADHDFSVVLPFVDAEGAEVSTSGSSTPSDFGPDNE